MPAKSEGADDKGLKNDVVGDGVINGPSNIYVLNVAFYSFTLFALVEVFVALCIAKSDAMVGDSVAMVIDSLTYLFNSYAERSKNISLQEKDEETLSAFEKESRRLVRTRQRLWLEILPPLCSVTTLIILIIYMIFDALNTLAQQNHYVAGGDGISTADQEPDIGVMFFFSVLNLALDILNVTCFARAKHAFGFAVIDKDRHRYTLVYDGSLHNQYTDSMRVRSEVDLSGLDVEEVRCRENYCSISDGNATSLPLQIGEEKQKLQRVNLNMCSAYTHVFADTLRSIAVLLAAGLSYMFKVGEPEEVDAIAALAVGVIILFSLGPLLRGILHAWWQMWHLSKFASGLPEERMQLN